MHQLTMSARRAHAPTNGRNHGHPVIPGPAVLAAVRARTAPAGAPQRYFFEQPGCRAALPKRLRVPRNRRHSTNRPFARRAASHQRRRRSSRPMHNLHERPSIAETQRSCRAAALARFDALSPAWQARTPPAPRRACANRASIESSEANVLNRSTCGFAE